MTLPVFDTWMVTGVDGPGYTVGPRCSNPRCKSWAEYVRHLDDVLPGESVESHHLVRRSKIAGAYDWVQVEGVGIVANKTALCPDCHRLITDNEMAIRYDAGLFVWCEARVDEFKSAHYTPVAPLFPQPPTPESLAEQTPGQKTESESCPFCGQTTKRRSPSPLPPGERRRRKSWTVSVPADAEEDGAEALDVLVDDLAPLLGYYGESTKEKARLRYFVLVPTLYFALTHKQEFIETIKGVG